jgi:hypothetical protein
VTELAAGADPAWLDWFWPAWLALLAGGFAFAETWALVSRGRGGTLSEKLRRWLGLDPPRPGRRWAFVVVTVALVGVAVWLPGHLAGWWP